MADEKHCQYLDPPKYLVPIFRGTLRLQVLMCNALSTCLKASKRVSCSVFDGVVVQVMCLFIVFFLFLIHFFDLLCIYLTETASFRAPPKKTLEPARSGLTASQQPIGAREVSVPDGPRTLPWVEAVYPHLGLSTPCAGEQMAMVSPFASQLVATGPILEEGTEITSALRAGVGGRPFWGSWETLAGWLV